MAKSENIMKAFELAKAQYAELGVDVEDATNKLEKFPFRIKMIRTDNVHEFQARFHWHCIEKGIEHVYIKPGSPNLKGKVERSHLTDKQEFYQLLDYTNDVNLREKIKEWEDFYNFNRPHKSHGGLTPYEVFKGKMNIEIQSQP